MKNGPRQNISRLASWALLWLGLGLPLWALTTYTPYRFTTLAGNAGGGSQDGPGPAARFSSAYGLTVDRKGNLYVADTNNHTIRKITPSGVVTTLAGLANVIGSTDGTGADARFKNPSGVAVDWKGNIYVADSGNGRIRKISPDGVVTTIAGAVGYAPYGVAVDQSGNIFFADMPRHTIRRITPDGAVTTIAGTADVSGNVDGTGAAVRFYWPKGIALDLNGNIFVADNGNNCIRKITPDGVVTTLAGSRSSALGSADGTGTAALFRNPLGVAVDESGTVFVTDGDNSTIRKITPAGVVTTFAGTAGHLGTVGYVGTADGIGTAAEFSRPHGITVDASGNLFVTDANKGTVRKITTTAVVTTLAGLPAIGTYADGIGTDAQFSHPTRPAIDNNGNVYVADMDNHIIRKITANGVVTTLAGTQGSTGFTDGTGTSARFTYPSGVAVDTNGNVFVADSNNHLIRKITASGVVTTLAGATGIGSSAGYADGTGAAARFNYPSSVGVDANGNVYVADTRNQVVRKITADGMVTTVAGTAGNSGNVDGVGAAARFADPVDIAVDKSGTLFVSDYYNATIRKITPDGAVTTLAGYKGLVPPRNVFIRFPAEVAVDGRGNVFIADNNGTIQRIAADGGVTTLAGLTGIYGCGDGTGAAARFGIKTSITSDADGNLVVADANNRTVSLGYLNRAPAAYSDTAATPVNQTVTLDLPATDADGDPITYTITGATAGSAKVSGTQVTYLPPPGFLGVSTLSFTATDGYATSASGNVTIVVKPAVTFLVNMSCRGQVGTGDNALIAGFVLSGTAPKNVLIRAAGPALIGQNVSGTISQPVITLFHGANRLISNQGWGTAGNVSDVATTATTVGAFSFDAGSNDSAILTTLNPGIYSAVVSSADGNPGISLVEVYDADTTNPASHPVNLSTRGKVGAGDNVLIAGVAITGASPKKLLVRAVGPTLATTFGLTGTLGDPQFRIYQGSAIITQNAGWNDDAQVQAAAAQTGAFALPAGSKDAAALVTLNPGNYTVVVSSQSGATGIAMVEVYQMP